MSDKNPINAAFNLQRQFLAMAARTAVDAHAALRLLAEQNAANLGALSELALQCLNQSKPGHAIALLKGLHDNGNGNAATAGLLGHAYVLRQDRKNFDAVKDGIKPEALRDYMDAKLCFLCGDFKGAQRILRPYVAGVAIEQPFAGLYVASLPDNSPMHDAIKAAVGNETYERLIRQRDQWRENPARAQDDPTKIHTSWRIFEEGGVAVNQVARGGATARRWEYLTGINPR